MKLELKHLAPYLPYGLECWVKDYPLDIGDKPTNNIHTLNALYNTDEPECVFHDLVESCQGFKEIKPVLRPLSDITNEIEKIRELFFKTDETISGGTSFTETLVYKDNKFQIKVEDYYWTGDNIKVYYKDIGDFKIYQYLFSHHFDVFGLIEKGLAINKNEI